MKHKVKPIIIFENDYSYENEQELINKFVAMRDMANSLMDYEEWLYEWLNPGNYAYRSILKDKNLVPDDHPYFRFIEKKQRPILALINRYSKKKGQVILRSCGRGEIGGKLFMIKDTEFKVVYR